MPAKEAKINTKLHVKRDDKFVFPEGFSSLEFDIIETPHFLVMSSGRVRGKDAAELAERLYHEMAFQYSGFEAKWGDEKKAIFLYAIESARELTPETTVLMYGFARYMQSTPARLASFSKAMERVDTSQTIPDPIEMAKMFGFESVAEFEADWIGYMKSTAFK